MLRRKKFPAVPDYKGAGKGAGQSAYPEVKSSLVPL